MSHNQLVEWLQNAKFEQSVIDQFRHNKVDGKQLWHNIRNTSMFLYNVGVVRPTLRDAIVQNIFMQLVPKTPGFDERHIDQFRNLQLITDGPISTVYKAVIKNKRELKLRQSTVIIKGYHFSADEIRVGKIIQILVHLVNNITSDLFVKIHGFILNMQDYTSHLSQSQAEENSSSSAANHKSDGSSGSGSDSSDSNSSDSSIGQPLNDDRASSAKSPRFKLHNHNHDRKNSTSASQSKSKSKSKSKNKSKNQKKARFPLKSSATTNTNTNHNSPIKYQKRPMFGIVMEYVSEGSIRSMIARRKLGKYNFMDKLGVLIDVASAICYSLHAKGYLHKNLKASNVLLSHDESVKLTDYCLDVTQITDVSFAQQTTERSLRWMAPELLVNSLATSVSTQYSTKTDVYAFGITMYEILSGNRPYFRYMQKDYLIQKVNSHILLISPI
jgi:serine/threonine protein kinase